MTKGREISAVFSPKATKIRGVTGSVKTCCVRREKDLTGFPSSAVGQALAPVLKERIPVSGKFENLPDLVVFFAFAAIISSVYQKPRACQAALRKLVSTR